jgi:hypothetical protein
MGLEVFTSMIGKTMTSVFGEVGADEMVFVASSGERFIFYHAQGCCERVDIQDVCGDLSDLCGAEIVEAEGISSEGRLPPPGLHCFDSCTWTFYRFSTSKGTVTVRWLGVSNGYYSESVSMRVENG